MSYNDVHLLPKEKISLFLFRFKRKRVENKIKCYNSLYFKRGFICQNFNGTDEMGCPIFDGTYSLSDDFREYKVSRVKWIIAHLPNWVAIAISMATLIFNILNNA